MAISVAVLVGNAQSWLPELIERAQKLKVNQGFEQGADLYVLSPSMIFDIHRRYSLVVPSSLQPRSNASLASLPLQRRKAASLHSTVVAIRCLRTLTATGWDPPSSRLQLRCDATGMLLLLCIQSKDVLRSLIARRSSALSCLSSL